MRDGTQTRKRLERCALTLFVEKGVAATTIKDIAGKAEIAEGTLYRHYQSKDELAEQLFIHSYKEIADNIKSIALAAPSLDLKIKNMVRYFCEKYDEDPILFSYLLLVQHNQIKLLDEKAIGAHEFLIPIFIEAIRKKEISKADPYFYSAILLGIVLQAAISRVYERITRTMTADADELSKVILAALKAK
jgi:AcrR family transcriptional regulator